MIIVLERWRRKDRPSPRIVAQRLIYDAKKNRIIHQYSYNGAWEDDVVTNRKPWLYHGQELTDYINYYLKNVNTVR